MKALSEDGQRSLAGYFYQILGSGKAAVEVLNCDPARLADGVIDLTFSLEIFRQDTATQYYQNGRKSITFGQYKHSCEPRDHPIDKTELVEIAEAFLRSTGDARKRDFKRFAYRLVTNRPFSPEARSLIALAKSDGPADWAHRRPRQKARRRLPRHLRQSWIEMGGILKSLETEASSSGDFVKSLTDHALSLGVLEDELPAGIRNLVGMLFEKAHSPLRTVSLGELDDSLSGINGVRPMTCEDVAAHMRDQLRAFQNESRIEPDFLVRRDVVDDISNAISEHALVIVEGTGGTGKTVALWKVVEELLMASPVPPPFGAINQSSYIDDFWLGQLVGAWRRSRLTSLGNNEPFDRAITRISRCTTPLAHPVIVLGLDAIDEVEDLPVPCLSVRKLVQQFVDEERRLENGMGEIRGTLVVTCRSWKELSLLDRSGWGEEEPPGKVVQLDKFRGGELARLAQSVLAEPVATMIARRANDLDLTTPVGMTSSILYGSQAVPSNRSIDDEVFEAIRHPVVWNCFRTLDNRDQQLALSGDAISLRKIADKLVSWFSSKAKIRHQGWRPLETAAIMRKVATEPRDPRSSGHVQKDWIAPAIRDGNCGEERARRLFVEALSAGLIIRVGSGEWRWQHYFLWDFLRTSAN